MSIFAFIGMPGVPEMMIVLLVMLLLFGHRLPSVMRSLGRGVVEFKKGVQGVEDDLDDVGRSIEDESSKRDAT